MFWPFNLKLGTQLTTYAAFAVAVTAGLAWVREDAMRDAETAMKLELANQTAKIVEESRLRQKKLDTVTKVLETTEKEAQRLLTENTTLLEKQRETVPLSDSCDKCRIPNERLWLRPRPKAASASARDGS